MLLTFLFLWLARPVLRSRTRRKQAINLLMLVLTIAGCIHPLTRAVAETQASKSGVTWTNDSNFDPTHSDFEDGRHPVDATQLFETPKLREGTTIPPTIGRVVNLGRRWAFVPLDNKPLNNKAKEKSTDPRSTGQRLTPAPSMRRQELASGEATIPMQNDSQPLLLCENQSLQRIVEAARANPNDDTWELSGEILEFFDQNRLLIRTAQRASGE